MGEKRICGAKRRDGQPCQARPMTNGRCRLHGGKSLGGLASPAFKTGRHSKYLPARMQEKYYEAVGDADLIALREDIALVDARIEDLIKRVDTGESGAAWGAAKANLELLKESLAKKDTTMMAAAMDGLDKVIRRGLADYAAWGEIQDSLEQRRKLVESERRRLVDMQQMITTERAMLLIAAITDVIRRNVTDRGQLQKIGNELSGLLAAREKEQRAEAGRANNSV